MGQLLHTGTNACVHVLTAMHACRDFKKSSWLDKPSELYTHSLDLDRLERDFVAKDFTEDLGAFKEFVAKQEVKGGYDIAEDVFTGVEALATLSWRQKVCESHEWVARALGKLG